MIAENIRNMMIVVIGGTIEIKGTEIEVEIEKEAMKEVIAIVITMTEKTADEGREIPMTGTDHVMIATTEEESVIDALNVILSRQRKTMITG